MIKKGTTTVNPEGYSKVYRGNTLVYESKLGQYAWLLDLLSRCDQNNQNVKACYIILNSQAFADNFNSIPFDNYENMIVKSSRDSSVIWYLDFIFFDNAPNFTINSDYVRPASSISGERYRFKFTNISSPRNTTISRKFHTKLWKYKFFVER